jgi:hypothetical protein
MQVAIGDIAEDAQETGKEYARKGGLIGGRKRVAKLSGVADNLGWVLLALR